MSAATAWFNGLPLDSALADSRALHYGDGVFRTLLVWQSRPLDLEAHLQRLAHDAAALRLAPPPAELLRAEAGQLAREHERAVLKIILARRPGGRGYGAATHEADRLLLLDAAPAYPAAWWDSGVSVDRSDVVLAAQPRLAGIKHLNRLEQVLASLDWPASLQERILCDAAGRAVCGTRSNLFWVERGALCTPTLAESGVAGVMRSKIIELASTLQVELNLMDRPWSELAGSAEEAFVCNALLGIWPLRALGGRALAAPGPLTRQLARALAHPRLC